ncbi:hypothetical protein [Streptomyces sp. MK37H]|uniref:hypothetical protein n=1 Tax=Streptomyces sp. MK37H TaxID=2699117 RepID=UPI001B385CD4|nr:hypothetical protein [Streptomyces sp. MK37H]MBP8533508.1 hypothetical protein [Streptomyces sp. MK37H]
MASNVGTVTVRRRLPSLRDVSMGPLAAFAVRWRCVVFDGLVSFVDLLACEGFEGFEVAEVVWDFVVDLPPRAGDAVFFAAVEELRLREVAGVVTGLTSTR